MTGFGKEFSGGIILRTHKCDCGGLKDSEYLRDIAIREDKSWHGREDDCRLSGILQKILDFGGILAVDVDVAVLENQGAVVFDTIEGVRLLLSKVLFEL